MTQNSVNKYVENLSEEAVLAKIREALAEHKTILLQAPTGCGKTYSFIKHAKERKGKTIFLVPNVANVKQISLEYGIPGLHGDEVKEGLWKDSNVVVATYDKAGAFLNSNLENLLVVLDEAHNLQSQANFRNVAIQRVLKLVEKAKEAVFLSATINHLDHNLYGHLMKFEPETPKNIIGSSKILLSGKSPNKAVALDLIRKLVAENKKCLVKMNNKGNLNCFKKDLDSSNVTSVVLTADNKDTSEVMKGILTEQVLPDDYQVVFCTSILDAGVNLKEVDVIIDVENGDPNSIRQLSARPRVSLGEHYIIIKGNTKNKNPEDRYTREKVEAAIKKRIETADSIEGDIKKIESQIKEETKEYLRFKFSLVESTLDEEFFIKVNSDGSYYVDIEAIRNKEYENLYNSLQTNPELLQSELLEYGLSTVIEEYQLKTSSKSSSESDEDLDEEEKTKKLSDQLKTLQALSTQSFALDCYKSEDREKYFSSQKWCKKVIVPFALFEVFGMYMALGFQYRLAYELILKSYNSKQKRKKIKNYITAYVYSKLKDDPAVIKSKGYEAFKLIYDLYSSEKVTKEDESIALKAYSKLLKKSYTPNHLTTRGKELCIVESKSTKENGKTVHHKEVKGFHTAKSILETFEITDQVFIDQFQELLDDKVERKLVNLNVNEVVAPNAPENDVSDPFEGESKLYFNLDFKVWIDKNKNGEGLQKKVPSPYFPTEVKSNTDSSEETTNTNEITASEIEDAEVA